jgi:hypothetical protein
MSGSGNTISTRRSGLAVFTVAVLVAATLGFSGASGASAAPQSEIPADSDAVLIRKAAMKASGMKILVSTKDKWLWLISSGDTLVSAPVAIGIGNTFTYDGKTTVFKTPKGKRTVRIKEANPVWTVPEWHYFEKAANRGLKAVRLQQDKPYLLEDGTYIDIRTDPEGRPSVGRVNLFGNWWPFSQDFEIIFDGKIFIPPMNTAQRRVTQALGPYKLDMGEGYLIHGTHEYNENSIGTAASHGCVRMRNSDLMLVYHLVEPGTPVYIF